MSWRSAQRRTNLGCPGVAHLNVVGSDGTPVRESTSEVAERLARQVDSLNAEIETLARHSTATLGVLTSQLGQIHVELDELAHRSRTDITGADR